MKLLIDLQKRKTYKWACTPCIILQKVSLIGLQKLTSSWHIKMSSLCSQWSENEALCLALGAFKKCYGPPVRRGKLCCFLVLEIELVFIQRTLDVSETWKRFLKVEEKKQTIKITKLYLQQQNYVSNLSFQNAIKGHPNVISVHWIYLSCIRSFLKVLRCCKICHHLLLVQCKRQVLTLLSWMS